MGWIYVIIAATLEIAGVVGLKMFSRKKNLANLLLFTGGFALSYHFLRRKPQTVPDRERRTDYHRRRRTQNGFIKQIKIQKTHISS